MPFHFQRTVRLARVLALAVMLAGQFVPTGVPATLADGPNPTYLPFSALNAGLAGAEPLSTQRGTTLYGSMINRDGSPLEGVTVTVQGHPEFGQAKSDANGRYKFEVNGGAPLPLNFSKPGYLPAQRWVSAGWGNDPLVETVALVPVDSAVTTIDLTSGATQIHRGTTQTDKDGDRAAALLFEPGTSAWIKRSDGVTQTINTLNVRATEYSVGPNGEAAMPAKLPPSSAYTYAFEFSADEAPAGSKIEFSRPVINYVPNFIGVKVGITVPVGIRLSNQPNWTPADDGRVVQIIDVTTGVAEIDIDGDGIADPADKLLRDLNIDESERRQIARDYKNRDELWRVPVRSTGSFDHNWPRRCKEVGANGQPTCKPPELKHFNNEEPFKDPCAADGSIIGCQLQTLADEVPIAGAPYDLYYTTARTPGFAGVPTFNLEIITGTVPTDLKRIEVSLAIAGRLITRTFEGPDIFAGQVFSYTWDGKDVDGNLRYGRQYYTAQVNYVYDAVYIQSSTGTAFGFGSVGINNFPIAPARFDIPKSQYLFGYLSARPAVQGSVGGWTPTVHHAYNPDTGELFLGDGRVRTSGANGVSEVITTVAGRDFRVDTGDDIGDGGPASQAGLYTPYGVAVAADGTVYVSELDGQRVRKITPSGIISTIAGTGLETSDTDVGDGLPATQATFRDPAGITIGPDGLLYIADLNNHRIRRVNADGRMTTVAGGGDPSLPDFGNGGPATKATLGSVSDVKFGLDGAMYILEFSGKVRRVTPDGTIYSFAGASTSDPDPGDGGPATAAKFNGPRFMTIGPDGSIYLAELGGDVVRRITPEGRAERVAGTGVPGFAPDNTPAVEGKISQPGGLGFGTDGQLYFSDSGNGLVRKLEGGKLVTTAGNTTGSKKGDGGAPAAAKLSSPYGIAFRPDGSYYIAEGGRHNLRLVQTVQPAQLSAGEYMVPSDNGAEVYVFDSKNRHVKTIDGLTGSVLLTFGYDANSRLSAITDSNGGVTTFERDANGQPTAIVAPFGQRTTLQTTNGYITQISNPNNETHQFVYTANGLLTKHTNPRGLISSYEYQDLTGRLVKATNPAGGETTLYRVDTSAGYYVGIKTPEGNIGGWQIQSEGGALVQYANPPGFGQRIDTAVYDDGVVNRQSANTQSRIASAIGPDPVWGMRSPIEVTSIYSTPGTLIQTVDRTITATLSQPGNPLSIASRREVVDVYPNKGASNQHRYESMYQAATRSLAEKSPAGRVITTTFDAAGRVQTYQRGGLAPVTFAYGTNGKPLNATQGSGARARVTQFTYNANGYLATLTQPDGGAFSFTYDAVGRVTSSTAPDGGVTRFTYDAKGNVTAIQPPARDPYTFSVNELDQTSGYTAPGGAAIQQTFDKEGRLKSIVRPDGQTATYTYPQAFPNGQKTTITTPSGDFNYVYAYQTALLSGVTAPGGVSQTLTYDGDVPVGETYAGPLTGVVTRTLDGAGAMPSIGVNGVVATYDYDKDNLVTRAAVGATRVDITRDPATGRIASTFMSGITTTVRTNEFMEPTHYSAGRSGTMYYKADFGVDLLGRVITKTEVISAVTTNYAYTYDAAGRLTQVQANGAPVAVYTYDANGNRLTSSRTGAAGVYNGLDQIVTYGGGTYSYNAAGELQSRVLGGATTNFGFNALGMLTAVNNGVTNVSYIVDNYGRRVAKQVNGVAVQGFLYQDRYRPAAELDGSSNVVSRFIYATDGPTPEYFIKGGVAYRIIPDALGSPRVVVNTTTGAVVQRMDYDEFGNVTLDTNPGFQPFGFAGGIYDRDTGLVHFGMREYDPQTGRWLSRDPQMFSGGSTNLYTYANNDPINFADPTGEWVEVSVAGFAGLGGGVKVTVNAEGFAITPEAGIGVGASLSAKVDPNLKLPKERLELNAEAKVGLGPLGNVGAAAKIDDCGDSEIKTKACLTVVCGEASVTGGFNKPPEWHSKGFGEGKYSFGSNAVKVGASAKVTASRPFVFRW